MGETPPAYPLTFPFMFASSLTVLPGSRRVFLGYLSDLTEIQCGKEENAKYLYGIGI